MLSNEPWRARSLSLECKQLDLAYIDVNESWAGTLGTELKYESEIVIESFDLEKLI